MKAPWPALLAGVFALAACAAPPPREVVRSSAHISAALADPARPALLASLLTALKPGGDVGVIDHYAAAGAEPFESVMSVHRIDPAVVIRDFVAAGFEAAGASDVLRTTDNDYSRSVFDAAVVGHTDRFVLRFRKPH